MVTKVFQANNKEIETIKNYFSADCFTALVPYSTARIKANNCLITIYTSKKVMLQGDNAEYYYNLFHNVDIILPQAGSDEVGTGDLFGPICVCATYIDQDTYDKIKHLKIIDSKQLNDEDILKIAPTLIDVCPHSLLLLDNEKFNQINKDNNLNEIKAKMHNQAYINLSKKIKLPSLCIIDDFCGKNIYYHYLSKEKEVITNITFETKAENKYISVAASAIISRYAFLKYFEQMNQNYNLIFPKGAGSIADDFLIKFINQYPNDLPKVAKLSWKNIRKLKD